MSGDVGEEDVTNEICFCGTVPFQVLTLPYGPVGRRSTWPYAQHLTVQCYVHMRGGQFKHVAVLRYLQTGHHRGVSYQVQRVHVERRL